VTADVTEAASILLGRASPAALPTITGFENHGGITTLNEGTTPLARVSRGIGNGDGSGTEGAVAGRVVGTYLHGPVLARNPVLADILLGWAFAPDALTPLDDAAHDALRAERLGTGDGGASRRKARSPARRH
jgi:CobQ-like glutamine amidotransferase family enzyme